MDESGYVISTEVEKSQSRINIRGGDLSTSVEVTGITVEVTEMMVEVTEMTVEVTEMTVEVTEIHLDF